MGEDGGKLNRLSASGSVSAASSPDGFDRVKVSSPSIALGILGSASMARLCSVETSLRRSSSVMTSPSRGLLGVGLLHGGVQLALLAQAERHRVDRLDVRDVPMGALADRLDRRLGGADELGDLPNPSARDGTSPATGSPPGGPAASTAAYSAGRGAFPRPRRRG
jgi:hypothetical protein